MFERADWFIMLAHANYVYIKPVSPTPMLLAPAAPHSMIPVPGLLLGAGEVDANHVYIQLVLPTLG